MDRLLTSRGGWVDGGSAAGDIAREGHGRRSGDPGPMDAYTGFVTTPAALPTGRGDPVAPRAVVPGGLPIEPDAAYRTQVVGAAVSTGAAPSIQ